MTEHAVVIAGAGPTGLMLAAELALSRVDVAIVERRANQHLAGSRAGGLGGSQHKRLQSVPAAPRRVTRLSSYYPWRRTSALRVPARSHAATIRHEP
ncbi:MAG TPA: FAD-dependent monooxygenase [Polyangiales bacterium]